MRVRGTSLLRRGRPWSRRANSPLRAGRAPPVARLAAPSPSLALSTEPSSPSRLTWILPLIAVSAVLVWLFSTRPDAPETTRGPAAGSSPAERSDDEADPNFDYGLR